MTVRERLGSEERSRFDIQYLKANAAAKDLAERHEELSLIPISQPDAVPKKQWRKKKTHGKANAPGLTAAESSDRDRLQAERLADKRRPTTPEAEIERVPMTPTGRKRTNTLVERTPGKPPTHTRAAPGSRDAPEIPPASTAPPLLYTRAGRERKKTKKLDRARAEGLLPESQPRN
jgi:hypothetical protein